MRISDGTVAAAVEELLDGFRLMYGPRGATTVTEAKCRAAALHAVELFASELLDVWLSKDGPQIKNIVLTERQCRVLQAAADLAQ